jgi:hypothetical protein
MRIARGIGLTWPDPKGFCVHFYEKVQPQLFQDLPGGWLRKPLGSLFGNELTGGRAFFPIDYPRR